MNKKDTTASITIDECITFYLGLSLSECTDIHLNTSANQKHFSNSVSVMHSPATVCEIV